MCSTWSRLVASVHRFCKAPKASSARALLTLSSCWRPAIWKEMWVNGVLIKKLKNKPKNYYLTKHQHKYYKLKICRKI
jgi:hypothetical protein